MVHPKILKSSLTKEKNGKHYDIEIRITQF